MADNRLTATLVYHCRLEVLRSRPNVTCSTALDRLHISSKLIPGRNIDFHITCYINGRISKARLCKCLGVIRILELSIKGLDRQKIDCAIVVFLASIHQALFGQNLVVVVHDTSASIE